MKARARGVFVSPLLGLLLLLSAAGLRVLALPCADDSPNMPAIDDYVEGELRAAHIPGLALAIVHADQVVKVRGYGSAGPGDNVVTPQTPFPIGSAGNSITALAIMQLAEAGRLGVDDPVQDHIPWFRLADPAASAQVTIRHLLSHTSGLSTLTGRSISIPQSGLGTIEERVRALQDARLSHQPGAAYEYSSANYDVLAQLVEAVSGQTYDSYIQERILAPLEMTHTSALQSKAQQAGLAVGHRMIVSLAVPIGQPMRRDGLASSAEDLAHFLVAQLNGGRYRGRAVLSARGISELQGLAVAASEEAGPERCSMGWTTTQLGELPVLASTGNEAGYYVDLVLLPEEQWGVAILANANSVLGPSKSRLDALAMGVLSRLLHRSPPAISLEGPGLWLLVLMLAIAGAIVQSVAAARLVAGRWRTRTSLPPGHRPLWRLLAPPALSFASALAMLAGVPALLRAPLGLILLVQPDLAYPLVANGAIALLRGALYSGFAVSTLWEAHHRRAGILRYGSTLPGREARKDPKSLEMAVPAKSTEPHTRRE